MANVYGAKVMPVKNVIRVGRMLHTSKTFLGHGQKPCLAGEGTYQIVKVGAGLPKVHPSTKA
eukprot:797994-Amphidinium_carterae.1